MATLGMDVGGILLTWPIHLHLLFFTSNEMGSIPCSSLVELRIGYFVSPKDVQNKDYLILVDVYFYDLHLLTIHHLDRSSLL